MRTQTLRAFLARAVADSSASAVARKLGVSYRVIPTYIAGACKFRTAAVIERRAAEIGWPSAERGER